jgi:hypothetical protein
MADWGQVRLGRVGCGRVWLMGFGVVRSGVVWLIWLGQVGLGRVRLGEVWSG